MTARRALAAALLVAVTAFAWLAYDVWRSTDDPAAEIERAWWRPGPPAGALEQLADGTVEAGLALLRDDSVPGPERFAGYRSRLREAERHLARSIVADPAQARALSKLAAIRWELDPPVSTAAQRPHLERVGLASRMAPRVPEVQQRLGTLLLRMGLEEDALPYFDRALRQRPELAAEIVPLLRDQLVPVGPVVERLPRSGDVLRAVVKTYDSPAEAREILDALEAALPTGDWKAVAAFGEACRRVGDAERSIVALEGLEPASDPRTEAERLLQRSRAAERLGRPDEAIVLAREAAALQPHGLRYLNGLGGAALRRGNADEAVDAFGRALAVHARLTDDARPLARLYRQIGQAEEVAGRADRAFEAYRRALSLDPDDPVAKRRMAEMEAAAGLR